MPERYRAAIDAEGVFWVEDTAPESGQVRWSEWGVDELENAQTCAATLNASPNSPDVRDDYYWSEPNYDDQPTFPVSYELPPRPEPIEDAMTVGPLQRFYIVRNPADQRRTGFLIVDQQTERAFRYATTFVQALYHARRLNTRKAYVHDFNWNKITSIRGFDPVPIVNAMEVPTDILDFNRAVQDFSSDATDHTVELFDRELSLIFDELDEMDAESRFDG